MADPIRVVRKNIFESALTKLINGRGVVHGVPAVLHVDLSAAVVHVADLLRFRGRNGDFYIFGKRNGNFTFADNKLRAEFIFFADPAGRADLLLHDVALFISGVAHGDLPDELARGRRIFTRNDRTTDFGGNFFANRSRAEILLSSS